MNAPAPEGASRPPSRWKRWIALAAFLIWGGTLAWLSETSANPVSINRLQVRRAASEGLVIDGTVLDARSGTCQVERILAAGARELDAVSQGQEIRVSNLAAAGARSGDRYVLPLLHRGSEFEIATGGRALPIPLIYPVGPETQAQLDDVFGVTASR